MGRYIKLILNTRQIYMSVCTPINSAHFETYPPLPTFGILHGSNSLYLAVREKSKNTPLLHASKKYLASIGIPLG
jgi:hypothetical protein